MIDDFYPLALQTMTRHLRRAGREFVEDDGDLLVGGHRLGLSVHFEGFAEQDGQFLAPLEVQLHLDGDDGDRFRVGALGVGKDYRAATEAAIAEWHTLAAAPLLNAMAGIGRARTSGRWNIYLGQPILRGTVPTALRSAASFYQALENCLDTTLAARQVQAHELLSLFIMATHAGGTLEVQAAVNGFVEPRFRQAVEGCPWPRPPSPYVYKQLYVARLAAK